MFRNIPFELVALLTLVLFITALCLLCYAKKYITTIQEWWLLTPFSLLLFWSSCLCCLFLRHATTRSYSFNHHNVDVWLIHAVSTPIGWTSIPLALLMAIHLPLSSILACQCRNHWKPLQDEDHLRTFHVSSDRGSDDSATAWEYPTCSHTDDSEKINTPFVKKTSTSKMITFLAMHACFVCFWILFEW